MLRSLVLALSLVVFSRGFEKYNLIPVTSPILQEELFKAKIYHETWTTVHFFDMTDLVKNADQLNLNIHDLEVECFAYIFCSHGKTLNALQMKIKKIQGTINALLSLSHDKREKRGLFNIVGTIQHYLFGTMSADDAGRINEQIDSVYNKTGSVAILINNQTAIMQSTIQKFVDITEYYKQNFEILNTTMKDLYADDSRVIFNNNMMECITYVDIHITK